MKRWTRWQDWVAVAAGLYAALVSIWMAPRAGAAMYMLLILGVLMIAAGVWSLAAPDVVSMEWVIAAIGVLLFISPWIGGFAGDPSSAWTAWICGAVGVIVGLWAIIPAMKAHKELGGGHRTAHA